MALLKPITQEDGVVTNYHRIQYLDKEINQSISICVTSYVSAEARTKEKDDLKFKPYKQLVTYMCEYDPGMTISRAYEWLKANISNFADAEDLFDEEQPDDVTGDEFISMVEEVL